MAQLVEESPSDRATPAWPDVTLTVLPSGLVTFLFTDIIGSTRAWDLDPSGMGEALRRHDLIVRSEIESSSGSVFARAGDSFGAAFSDSRQALNAAIGAQRALQAARWPDDVELNVRCALHRGVADEREGNYFGPDVNVCSRMLAHCAAGEIALTDGLRLAGEAVVGTSRMVDLGWQKLPDISAARRLWVIRVAADRRSSSVH